MPKTIQELKEYRHNHYLKNKPSYIISTKLWKENHPEQWKEIIRKSYIKHKIKRRQYEKKYRLKWKLQVFMYYSNGLPRCNCCNEVRLEFLTIDHINNDGYKDRKSKKYHNIYKYLIDNNFPKEFQVLCMNCNWAKGKYGKCPHKGDKSYQ